MSGRTILIMAGGTGGHVYPGLAVAQVLMGRGWRAVWLGTRSGLEARVVPAHGIPMAWLSFGGVRGKGWLRKLLLPIALLVAFWQSARALFAHRPDVVLGMGGYAAFPGGLMASLFNRPLVIHEQNSVAGLTNRVLACLADRVLVGFPDALRGPRDAPIPCRRVDTFWTGNPVRAEIAALPDPAARYGGRNGPLRLLVVGGSLGAQALNEVVPRALAQLPPEIRPQVVHQTGGPHFAAVKARYQAAGVQAEILPFIDDMASRYAEADLVVCRAGALTIAELAAAGVASILVPYPHAVDDHQTTNAKFLADAGAALFVPQPDLSPERLARLFGQLTRQRLAEMALQARALAKPDAAQVVAQVCMELAA
ncbi:undecaprenyldiphospho-muramoylpentapeptide beta-N-acetylglucosaminyltransferase [Thiobacter aerophilum]|uniref:UDP-N-acetylglucosamine--N-acetylmuramyl-(pentapeptide) pyrophosphoryl-undecaprenol N-acetylglucosamine transferase n=1 Tax=Thiobacter aerophilum TaxID=3121275 RepID=A0ABV0EFX5_9BURK